MVVIPSGVMLRKSNLYASLVGIHRYKNDGKARQSASLLTVKQVNIIPSSHLAHLRCNK